MNYNNNGFVLSFDDSDRQGAVTYIYHDGQYGTDWYNYTDLNKNPMIDLYTNQEQFMWDVFESDCYIHNTNKLSSIKSNIYPNPTTGIIKLEDVKDATIKIYTLSGSLVKIFRSFSTNTSLNMKDLTKGTYIIKIINKNYTIINKINLLK